MQVGPAQLPSRSGARSESLPRAAIIGAPRLRLRVASIGHLVARKGFAGRVHSVFAHACNIACGDTLLTLLDAGGDGGPTMLVLAPDAAAHDLRSLFDIGEAITGRGDAIVRSRRTELRLGGAAVWNPAVPRALASPSRIGERSRLAAAQLARARRGRSSVIDREGRDVAIALVRACRALDREAALDSIDRLIGWGEGLTPAGDDFLVGWITALRGLAGGSKERQRFVDDVGALLAAAALRTTPFAAQALRLAVRGHVVASLDALRDALLGGDDGDARLERALGRALALGATSGADMVSGLLSGLSAWLPATEQP